MTRKIFAMAIWGVLMLTAGARAHGTNPLHLNSMIMNPFVVTGRIDAVATDKSHFAWWGGDLAIDVVPNRGAVAGATVKFKAVTPRTGTYVRGRILSGGKGDLEIVCWTGLASSGGYL